MTSLAHETTACAACGARISRDAAWCSLCYAVTPHAAATAPPAATAPVTAPDRRVPAVPARAVMAAALGLLVVVAVVLGVRARLGGSDEPLGVDPGAPRPIPAELPVGSAGQPA